MKKRLANFFLAIVMCVATLGLFTACGDNSSNLDEAVGYTPTKAEIVTARQLAIEETIQSYDFNLTIKGNFSLLGIGSSLAGHYDGSYYYDSSTDNVLFKRKTSGPLLYDSTAYVFTSGDSRIKLTTDNDEENVKKLSVEVPEDQNITMVNLPIIAIVNSIKEENIDKVSALKNSEYAYSCSIKLDSTNSLYNILNQVFEKLGTGVSFKGVELKTNISTLDFNLKNNKLSNFKFGFQMEIEVKGVKVGLNIEYKQKDSSTAISIPDYTNSGIMYTETGIQSEVDLINSAIEDLKNDEIYSLDLTAKNEFDPGWNKLATTDSYKARMYKNGDWFNHSYCYKAHSEEDGKESYKYTLGNVNGDNENQGTWLISRKSSNSQTKVNDVTANSQFDFLTSMIKLNANEIDCINKQTKNENTIYTIYLGRAGTISTQQKIIDMINTNEYDDVIEVNNYFNIENIVKNSEIEITFTNGKIASIKCKTELCYTPLDGDYTEYNITLNNTIELFVNKQYNEAASYEAPTKVKGTLGIGNNLDDKSNYIL